MYPQSALGYVRIKLRDNTYRSASGTLIAPDLVLTAAHAVYDKIAKEKYENIEFIPGLNNLNTPFGISNVTKTYVPEAYISTGKDENYALLVLEGTPGLQAGYFGLHIAKSEVLLGKTVRLYGYPEYLGSTNERSGLKQLSTNCRHQLWGMEAKFEQFVSNIDESESIIRVEIQTTPGQDGSGLFYQSEDGKYYVIGINVHGTETGECLSTATTITEKTFDQIMNWIGQSKQ